MSKGNTGTGLHVAIPTLKPFYALFVVCLTKSVGKIVVSGSEQTNGERACQIVIVGYPTDVGGGPWHTSCEFIQS